MGGRGAGHARVVAFGPSCLTSTSQNSASTDAEGVCGAVSVYYDDASIMEPQPATMYDAILPRLDKALGETPAQKKPFD